MVQPELYQQSPRPMRQEEEVREEEIDSERVTTPEVYSILQACIRRTRTYMGNTMKQMFTLRFY